MRTVAVIAPHPDDESIFCGATIARLADLGHRVVVVAATDGGAGRAVDRDLATVRHAELDAAAAILGCHGVHHLGLGDSGLSAEPHAGSFAALDPSLCAAPLADLLRDLAVTDLICDPVGGIYPHHDHRQAHEVTLRTASLLGIESVLAMTVDREHLHFVETHLVVDAHRSFELSAPGAPPGFGASTVEIDVEVRSEQPHLDRKRSAMAAHASQMPPHSAVMRLGPDAFRSVYGIEWFIRVGTDDTLERILRA